MASLQLTLATAICAISIILLLLLCFIIYSRWTWNYWTKRGVRGPLPLLFKGTFPKSTNGSCNLIEELHEIYLTYKSNEKYVGVFTARSPKLFILQPQLATAILTQHFRHFHDNESSEWTNSRVEKLRVFSPFVSKGDEWKQRRGELVPALSSNRLRAFYDVMRGSAAKLVEFLAVCEGQVLDAKEAANRYTAEFMGNFIWGIEAGAFIDAARTFRCAVHEMANSMITQSLAAVSYFGRTAALPVVRRIRPKRFFPHSSDTFFQRLVNDAVRLRQSNGSGGVARCDVIDHLLQLSRKRALSDIQIAGHTTTTLIDGFETAAIVAAHCLLLLSRNSHVQQKLRKELLTAGKDISYDALMELPYLDQCVQETLRIFPPLPTLFKICTESITLCNHDNSTLTLQPGDVVYISSYSFHRDADYYERPEEFRPERFDAECGGVRKYRELGVFLPFGDGPRICAGMKLGLSEVKVAVAEILRVFDVRCGNDTRKDNKIEANSFLLTLAGGIQLAFEKL